MKPLVLSSTPLQITTPAGSVSVLPGVSTPIPIPGAWTFTSTNGSATWTNDTSTELVLVSESPSGPSFIALPSTVAQDIGLGIGLGFTLAVVPIVARFFRRQPMSPGGLE